MAETSAPVPQRLYSLDALRGFDMFWIMGGEDIVYALAKATGAAFWVACADQFVHPDWHGFRMYDLIFPLFLFLAGVATPYSVGRELEQGKTRQQLMMRVIRRGLILVLLGVIYNNGLVIKPIAEIRFPSVLGRIGLAYMFANIIYLYTKERGQFIWFFALLIGYWILFLIGHAPGYPMGDLTMEGNIVSYIDRSILPGRLYLGIHDPEGLVATLPAIGTALLGIFAGTLLKESTLKETQKVIRLIIMGVGFIIVAQLWNLIFPINKNLWTSTFVLHVGGISLLFLAVFYYIIDVLHYRKWAFFFTIIGMNSILIYMSGRFIDWEYSTNAFLGWLIHLFSEPSSLVVGAICYVMVKWVFLYFLYKKKVFLRV